LNVVDNKYISLVSARLDKFSKKNKVYNFRCPYCGDSQKYKNKARGYLYPIKNDYNFRCHNCGVVKTLTNFIKDQDPVIYKQYVMERYKNGSVGKRSNTPVPKFDFEKPEFNKQKYTIDLESIADLNKEHPARKYLEKSRKFPRKTLENLYYCSNFKEWTNEKKLTFDSVAKDEPRIIIPLEYNGTLIGYQGRSLLPKSKIKYITIMLEEDAPKIYGLDHVKKNQNVYVTEGPFDSTFLPNSIAMCGADGDVRRWGINDPVWIYDNEPRNREIVKRISDTIDRGERVVIFPSNIPEKDINDMVLSGRDVKKMVESNIYQGLEAKLKLQTWKRI
jgi:hypothetical protein